MNTTFDRILWKKNKNKISYALIKKTLLSTGYTIESTTNKISATRTLNNGRRFHLIVDKPIDTRIIHCGINLHKDLDVGLNVGLNVGIKKIDHVSFEYDTDISRELIKFCNKLNRLIFNKRELEKYIEYDNLLFTFRWN